MPSFVNGTDVSSVANAALSSNHTPIHTNTSNLHWYDSTNNLGYGVGRLLRGAFDHIWLTWQGFWNVSSSQEEITHQKKAMIYKKGLEECVIHLEIAIDNLRKNPRNPQSMEKIKKVAAHYAPYVNSAPTEKLRLYQQKVFQRIGERVDTFVNPRLKKTLMEFLPFLSSKHVEMLKIQELAQGLHMESVASKSKRAVQAAAFPASFNLSSLDGSNGFIVSGVAAGGYLGYSVSSAGDINGDGIDDLVVGAYGVNSDWGASYVIFGSQSGFPVFFNLTALNGTNGFAIPGLAAGLLGISVSTAGDMNGDNLNDLALGAYSINSGLGTSYVIFGSRSKFSSSFDLTTLNGSNGFAIPGVTADENLGSSVSSAGDINGDGIGDLVVGAYGANLDWGLGYVIFGSRSGFPASFNLTTLNGNNGFAIAGVGAGLLGISVSTAGDMNGDDLSDLVLGTDNANSDWGASYVIFGSRSGFPASFNLIALNGTNGFVIPGVAPHGRLGFSVSSAGDINGDNLSDLVLGAYNVSSYAGASYVIFGSRNGFPASFNLTALNGTNGFTILGVASYGALGFSVSTVGDMNGDNLGDLVLGTPYVNSYLGASYIIFGSRSEFPAFFNLNALNGTNGFAIPGVVADGFLGGWVSTVGDMNGDNLSDVVLGAPDVNSESGASYIIFGVNTTLPLLTPTPTPTTIFPLTPCSDGQPLTLNNNNIHVNKGQNLRLTPNDLSASCKNATTPNLGTNFSIISINHAQFKTRNNSGFWANASSFLGRDLYQGNVELIQDNSTVAPDINFTVTDGQANLTAAADVQFSTSESSVQIISIVFNIPSNGTIILSPPQFQINATGIKLDDVVISVVSNQGGYFTTVIDPNSTISDFTYYQVQTSQIQFVHNGTAVPNITLSIGDGSGLPVLVSPIVNLFDTQTQNPGTIPKDVIIGSIVGAFALIAAGGLTALGIFKYKEKRDHMVQQFGKAQAQDYRTHPPKPMNSY